MSQATSHSKKALVSVSRHIIKLPQQQQQQKLSYQTNKLAQYIELQLSDLQNTLHYIQKKHSINQIKQSISHSYNIFSQTQAIFRQLRINFVYQKIKKLVNCFSIIYLILIQHIQKPSRYSIENQTIKNNQGQLQTNYQESTVLKRLTQKKNTINATSQLVQLSNNSNSIKRPKPLGGIHLYNQQYNRHIQSDLDRLKRKLKQQAKQLQDSQNPKLSEKQRLKQQIFKQINSDIYGSPSPDELTLFFNLNCNRYGSQLQYLTFQDQLQQIAAFFKQSQDQALQFLNKSRDQFIFLNFNQGFKQALVQYKTQKQQQVNEFVIKVKNLFQLVKVKTLQKQQEINNQYVELKKLEEKINKPQTFDIQTQTSFNFQEEIARLKKKYQELQNNYNALKDYKKNQNQNQQKNLTYLEHKIAFKDHQINIIKKQLDQKSHFIDFLNQKINSGVDPKLLRKISNIYRSHSKKNSSKLKVELQQLQKQSVGDNSNTKKSSKFSKFNSQDQRNKKQSKGNYQSEAQDQQNQLKRSNKKNLTQPQPQFQKSHIKRKRKPGISFFTSNDKKFSTLIQRNASFNFQNIKIQQANSQLQQATSQDIPLFQQRFQQNQQLQNNQNNSRNPNKLGKQKKNLVKNDKRKMQDRSSLQVIQKSKQKKFEPKRSAFAAGLQNKYLSKQPNSQRTSRIQSLNQNNISQQSEQNSAQQEAILMDQLNKMTKYKDNELDQQNGEFQGEEGQQFDTQEQELTNYNMKFLEKPKVQNNSLTVKNSSKLIMQSKEGKDTNGSKNTNHRPSLKQASFLENKKNVTSSSFKSGGVMNTQSKNGTKTYKNDKQRFLKEVSAQLSKKQSQKKSPLKKKYSNSIQYGEEQTKSIGMNKRFQSFQINQQTNTNNLNALQIQLQQNSNPVVNQSEQNNGQSMNGFGGDTQYRKKKLNDMQIDQLKELFKQHAEVIDLLNSEHQFHNKTQQEKQKIINNYYGNLIKKQKIKCVNLNSKIIDISIAGEPNSINNKKSFNQTYTLLQLKQNINSVNRINLITPNNRSELNSTFSKSKNSSCGNFSELYNNRKAKLSQLPYAETLNKFRDNKIASQNLIQNLQSFHQINNPKETNHLQTLASKNVIESIKKTQNSDTKSNQNYQYEKIYGLTTNSCFRNKNQNSFNQKMEQHLQKIAAKIALKCKNLQQFKQKIRKAHMSKCGQSCKHLQRYAQNYGKYKSNNRQILKVHIQNVNNSIYRCDSQSKQRQNFSNFQGINMFNNTANSFKSGSNLPIISGLGTRK